MVSSLVNMEGEESFDASLLGKAGSVEQIRVCDDELILIKKYVYSKRVLFLHFVLKMRLVFVFCLK